MRRIRASRNMSVGDVHDETKIPLGLIEAFEDKALFDHPQFNRVYLRSFVRTYAQVVGIDADVALEGLEEALSGRYAGSLAVTYLGEEPADSKEEETVESDAAASEEPEEEAVHAETPFDDDDTDETSGPSDDGDQPTSFVSTTQSTAAGYQQSHEQPEEEEAGDWSAQSPPSARADQVSRRSIRSSQRTSTSSGPDKRWVLGIVLLVVIGAVIWLLVSVLGGSDSGQSTPTAVTDTTERAMPTDAPTEPVQTIDVPPLGDSMAVRIVATEGKVDPIRVTVDDDLRRPYWIERGDSLTFRPVNRIVIEELLDSVTVKIEGITFPTSRQDAQGRLVISRDTAQAYFSSLRGR